MGKHIFTSDQKLEWWGCGEWVEEVDEEEWEYKSIRCKIVRMAALEGALSIRVFGGYLCGYIQVPKDHPWFMKDSHEIDVSLHGGISYYNFDEKGVFWLGFDAAHSGDLVPSMQAITNQIEDKTVEHLARTLGIELGKIPSRPIFHRQYRNVFYMKKECENLVDQLLEAEAHPSTSTTQIP